MTTETTESQFDTSKLTVTETCMAPFSAIKSFTPYFFGVKTRKNLNNLEVEQSAGYFSSRQNTIDSLNAIFHDNTGKKSNTVSCTSNINNTNTNTIDIENKNQNSFGSTFQSLLLPSSKLQQQTPNNLNCQNDENVNVNVNDEDTDTDEREDIIETMHVSLSWNVSELLNQQLQSKSGGHPNSIRAPVIDESDPEIDVDDENDDPPPDLRPIFDNNTVDPMDIPTNRNVIDHQMHSPNQTSINSPHVAVTLLSQSSQGITPSSMKNGSETFISEDSDVSDHEEEEKENEETEDEGVVEEDNMPSLVNNNDQHNNLTNKLTSSEKSNLPTNVTNSAHHISKSISQSLLKRSNLSEDEKNSKSRERSISLDTALLNSHHQTTSLNFAMNVAQQSQPSLQKQDQQSQNIQHIPNDMTTKEIQSEAKKKKKRKKKKKTTNKEMEDARNNDTISTGANEQSVDSAIEERLQHQLQIQQQQKIQQEQLRTQIQWQTSSQQVMKNPSTTTPEKESNKDVSGNLKRVRQGSTSSKSGNQQKSQQQKDSKKQKNKESDIWNMTEADERKKIREFWLSLTDQERANLIKMEKEAILQKMKRNLQRRSSCSCDTCDSRRSAIEEQLELLYDAYYEELERYTNPQAALSLLFDDSGNLTFSKGGMLSVADDLIKNEGKKFLAMMERLAERRIRKNNETTTKSTRPVQQQLRRNRFPNANTTTNAHNNPYVASNIKNNNGSTNNDNTTSRNDISNVANNAATSIQNTNSVTPSPHLPPPRITREFLGSEHHRYQFEHNNDNFVEDDDFENEYDDDDEDEDDYDDDDDDDDEDEDPLTDEQRLEESKKIFQMFAAKLFEQRVISAYREKVALEKQKKLLEEEEEKERIEQQKRELRQRKREQQKLKQKLKKQQQEEEERERKRKEEEERKKREREELLRKKQEEERREEQRRQEELQRRQKQQSQAQQQQQKQKKKKKKAKKQVPNDQNKENEKRRKRKEQIREREAKTDDKEEQNEEEKPKQEQLVFPLFDENFVLPITSLSTKKKKKRKNKVKKSQPETYIPGETPVGRDNKNFKSAPMTSIHSINSPRQKSPDATSSSISTSPSISESTSASGTLEADKNLNYNTQDTHFVSQQLSQHYQQHQYQDSDPRSVSPMVNVSSTGVLFNQASTMSTTPSRINRAVNAPNVATYGLRHRENTFTPNSNLFIPPAYNQPQHLNPFPFVLTSNSAVPSPLISNPKFVPGFVPPFIHPNIQYPPTGHSILFPNRVPYANPVNTSARLTTSGPIPMYEKPSSISPSSMTVPVSNVSNIPVAVQQQGQGQFHLMHPQQPPNLFIPPGVTLLPSVPPPPLIPTQTQTQQQQQQPPYQINRMTQNHPLSNPQFLNKTINNTENGNNISISQSPTITTTVTESTVSPLNVTSSGILSASNFTPQTLPNGGTNSTTVPTPTSVPVISTVVHEKNNTEDSKIQNIPSSPMTQKNPYPTSSFVPSSTVSPQNSQDPTLHTGTKDDEDLSFDPLLPLSDDELDHRSISSKQPNEISTSQWTTTTAPSQKFNEFVKDDPVLRGRPTKGVSPFSKLQNLEMTTRAQIAFEVVRRSLLDDQETSTKRSLPMPFSEWWRLMVEIDPGLDLKLLNPTGDLIAFMKEMDNRLLISCGYLNNNGSNTFKRSEEPYVLEVKDGEMECFICNENTSDVVLIPCYHSLCQKCFSKMSLQPIGVPIKDKKDLDLQCVFCKKSVIQTKSIGKKFNNTNNTNNSISNINNSILSSSSTQSNSNLSENSVVVVIPSNSNDSSNNTTVMMSNNSSTVSSTPNNNNNNLLLTTFIGWHPLSSASSSAPSPSTTTTTTSTAVPSFTPQTLLQSNNGTGQYNFWSSGTTMTSSSPRSNDSNNTKLNSSSNLSPPFKPSSQ